LQPIDLPKDLEAEVQVLGSIMIRPDLIFQVSNIIKKSDFFLTAHQLIFEALENLIKESESILEIEPVRLIQYLEDRKLLEDAGGAEYIFQLSDKVISPTNALHHAVRLHNLSTRRKLILKLKELEQHAYEPQENEGSFFKICRRRIIKNYWRKHHTRNCCNRRHKR